jgi:pimeloyl-ACP methyl ester carboxylesterase
MSEPEPESRYLTVNGVRLHYLAWDSGKPPLIIVHGNTHAGGVYAPLAARLASDYSVYAIDLRGHGLSAQPDAYDWSDFRSDIAAFMDALDLRDVVFVAHSRGGGITLLTVASWPERVRAAVVYEPTYPQQFVQTGASVASPEERQKQLAAVASRRRSTFPSKGAMYEHFHGRGAFKGWRDDFLHAFVEHCSVDSEDGGVTLASPTRVEVLLYQAITNSSEWDKLAPCDVPLLAVYGELGGRLGPGRDPVAYIRRFFPRVQTRLLQGATHSGPMEFPEEFERIIRDFLASAGA